MTLKQVKICISTQIQSDFCGGLYEEKFYNKGCSFETKIRKNNIKDMLHASSFHSHVIG